MASDAVMMIKGVSEVNDLMASPRAFWMGAPIDGRAGTARIGAAENFPRAHGDRAIPAGRRLTIAVQGTPRASYHAGASAAASPRPPESSTVRDTATESAQAPSASDTDVVPARVHGVDRLAPGVKGGSNATDRNWEPKLQGPRRANPDAVCTVSVSEVARTRTRNRDEDDPKDSGARKQGPGVFIDNSANWQLNSCWLFSGRVFRWALAHLRTPYSWQH
jgi:hypothetical protein